MKRAFESIFIMVFIALILIITGHFLFNASEHAKIVYSHKSAGTNAILTATRRKMPDFLIGTSSSIDSSNIRSNTITIKSPVISNDYVFSFYDEADMKLFISRLDEKKGRITGTIPAINAVRVKVNSNVRLEDVLTGMPMPVASGNNVRMRIPDDTKARELEGEQYSAFGRDAPLWLGVPPDNALWGKNVTIAIIDTGINEKNIWKQIDLLGTEELGATVNHENFVITNNHGTAILKVILGDKSANILGVAPAARILSVRALNNDGTGDAFTVARGIIAAVDNGANIINMSFGGPDDLFVVQKAVKYAVEKGVVLVAAVGNDGVDAVSYPAAYDDVIAVSGVDASARHLYFANYGDTVDISAPAFAVATADSAGTPLFASGTSIAAPFVSSVAAALLSLKGSLRSDEIKKIICENADDWGIAGKDEVYGAGILNVERIISCDKKGIFDVAVGPPFVKKSDDGTFALTIYVQNRGTETIPQANLLMEIDGVKSIVPLYNIAVSESVSRVWQFPKEKVNNKDGIKISYFAVIDGVSDSRPYNNGPITFQIIQSVWEK